MVAVSLLAAMIATAGAQEYTFGRQDAVAVDVGVRAIGALRPAYRLAEGLSDGVFAFLRQGVFRSLLHGAPKAHLNGDSFTAFQRQFRKKQEVLVQRLSETYRPTGPEWDWAAEAQTHVVLDAFRDTLLERYQMDSLGRWAGDRAMSGARGEDPSSIAGAGAIGGAFLYFGGGRAEAHLGDATVGVEMAPVRKLVKAAADKGDLGRAIGIELRKKDSPWSLSAGMGVSRGKVAPGAYALRYRLTF
jgi:hypothetical protein